MFWEPEKRVEKFDDFEIKINPEFSSNHNFVIICSIFLQIEKYFMRSSKLCVVLI